MAFRGLEDNEKGKRSTTKQILALLFGPWIYKRYPRSVLVSQLIQLQRFNFRSFNLQNTIAVIHILSIRHRMQISTYLLQAALGLAFLGPALASPVAVEALAVRAEDCRQECDNGQTQCVEELPAGGLERTAGLIVWYA